MENVRCPGYNMERVQHWQLANVNDTLKKHWAWQIINHSQPSLIIHDRKEKQERAVSNKIHSGAEASYN